MKRTMPLIIAALCLAGAAGAQQAPPSKTEPAKPKTKRVWTNEDIGTVRTVSDEYADKKAAEAEKAKQAQTTAAANPSAPTKPAAKKEKDYLPTSLPEAEKRLAAKQYEIDQQYEAVDRVKKEQEQATTPEARAAFQKRIDVLTATLEESVAEMHALDARVQELKANAPASAQPAAPADAASPQAAIAELEKQIAEKQEKVENLTEQVQRVREAVAGADSETTRASLQKKLDGLTALLEKTNGEVKALEEKLQEAKSKPEAPKPETPKP